MNLILHVLDCRRNQMYIEKTHTLTGRTYKPHPKNKKQKSEPQNQTGDPLTVRQNH